MRISFAKKHTIRRYTGGLWDDNGEWQKGSYEEISIMASVQPLSHNEAQLPEGRTYFSGVKIYSDEQLIPGKQELQNGMLLKEGDVLVWRGRLWQVIQCDEWENDFLAHYKSIAWELSPAEDDTTEPEPEEVEPDADGDAEISP